ECLAYGLTRERSATLEIPGPGIRERAVARNVAEGAHVAGDLAHSPLGQRAPTWFRLGRAAQPHPPVRDIDVADGDVWDLRGACCCFSQRPHDRQTRARKIVQTHAAALLDLVVGERPRRLPR